MNRFYLNPLEPGEHALEADQAHHALHVLRLRKGAEVELFDGSGRAARGAVTGSGRRELRVAVGEVPSPEPPPSPPAHLAFAVPKGKRLDWLLEKATELAAATLRPVIFERSVAGGSELSSHKRSRWRLHCIAAAKQCGLNWLPEIRDPVSLADWLAARGDAVRLLGDTGAEAVSAADALAAARPQQPVAVLVGPEGGLSDAERAACLDAGLRPVRLGRTTLRIETAALGLLAAVRTICD